MATLESDILWALGEFNPGNKRLKAYRVFDSYYNGDQPLAFATKKYRGQFWSIFQGYADNMCQSVVDVQAERLEVNGFTSSAATVQEKTIKGAPDDQGNRAEVTISLVDDPVGETAWEEWESEGMPLVSDQIHSDVFKYGDAFLIIDKTGVWRQEPSEIAVRYSKENPGQIEAAAKLWRDPDDTVHLYVYRTDGLTKHVTKQPRKKGTRLTPEMFSADGPASDLPQGIPVVHFSNKVYGKYGISELLPVIPLQDALNKAEMDLIIAMEYQAFRQRWIAGVDVEIDPETGMPKNFPGSHGPGNYLSFSDPEAKVGEFGAADLAPYIKVIDNLRAQIARVSGIPPHYFFSNDSGATVSGETLKVAESRFTRKGKRQQRCFGKVWEFAMDLVLEITDAAGGADYQEGTDLNALWEETSPRSESEDLDVLIKKQVIGVPNSQLQMECGYDPDEVERFAVEYAENVKLGLQTPPNKNAAGQALTPHGEATGSAQSQVSGTSGTTPPAE